MARHRKLSTSISVDPKVNKLISAHGEFAGLLYTWLIPHVEDNATMTGDIEEILMTVIPGIRNKEPDDVARALIGMTEVGLVAWDGDTIYFPVESFYRHQNYVQQKNRRSEHHRKTPQNAEEVRQTPQNASSLSPSYSHSLSHSPSEAEEETEPKKPSLAVARCDRFDEFWAEYPRKIGKADAKRAWTTRLKKGADAGVLISAVSTYVAYIERNSIETKFIAHPATWLRQGREEDVLTDEPRASMSTGQRNIASVLNRIRGGDDEPGAVGQGPRGAYAVLPASQSS